MSTKRDIRDYGLVDSEPTSIPTATPTKGKVCPNCRCKEIMVISVKVKQNLLKGGKGTGTYLGCPACPWASPMMMSAA